MDVYFSRYPLTLCALCVFAPLRWVFILQVLLTDTENMAI